MSLQKLLIFADENPDLTEDMLAEELVKQIEIEKAISQFQYEWDAEWLNFVDRFLDAHNRSQDKTC